MRFKGTEVRDGRQCEWVGGSESTQVSAQGSAILGREEVCILGSMSSFCHPQDWERDRKTGKPGSRGAETRLEKLETGEYDINHQWNSAMNH